MPESWDEAVIRKIAGLGHEIGYHYESLSACKGDPGRAREDFQANLAKLRDTEGSKGVRPCRGRHTGPGGFRIRYSGREYCALGGFGRAGGAAGAGDDQYASPQRWHDRPLPWIKELVWQNAKNVVEKLLAKRGVRAKIDSRQAAKRERREVIGETDGAAFFFLASLRLGVK